MRLDRAMLKTEADGLRSRAVGGYDFDQLQVQAYTDLGIPQPSPLTMARRNSMPEDQAQVFDSQPGEITPVIESYEAGISEVGLETHRYVRVRVAGHQGCR